MVTRVIASNHFVAYWQLGNFLPLVPYIRYTGENEKSHASLTDSHNVPLFY